jgi:hypothetical protein
MLYIAGSSPRWVKQKTMKLVFVATQPARTIKESKQRIAGRNHNNVPVHMVHMFNCGLLFKKSQNSD